MQPTVSEVLPLLEAHVCPPPASAILPLPAFARRFLLPVLLARQEIVSVFGHVIWFHEELLCRSWQSDMEDPEYMKGDRK